MVAAWKTTSFLFGIRPPFAGAKLADFPEWQEKLLQSGFHKLSQKKTRSPVSVRRSAQPQRGETGHSQLSMQKAKETLPRT